MHSHQSKRLYPISELIAHDFPARVPGDFVDELVGPRPGEVRHVLVGLVPLGEIRFGDLAVGSDEREDDLAPLLVGHADHADVLDGRVAREHVLDGRGVDVLAAGDDDVVGTTGDDDVAVVLFVDRIAGEEPAVVNSLGGVFRLV